METTSPPHHARSTWPIVLAVVVAVAVFLSACGSRSNTEQDASDVPADSGIDSTEVAGESVRADTTESVEDAEPDQPEPLIPLRDGILAETGQRTNWRVEIDGSIGASMWLAQHEGFVRGEITYDNGNAPIDIIGLRYDSGVDYYIHEFSPDGRSSGTLIIETVRDGTISKATWHGTTFDPLPATVTFDSVDAEPYFFDPFVRPGVYEYAFGPFEGDDECCGAVGALTISTVSEDSAVIDFVNNSGAPGYNVAYVDKTEVPRDGNVLRFEAVEPEIRSCLRDITVFDGFAFVTAVDDDFECGFGLNAHVIGIYVLTEPLVAAEDSPFADAELTANSFGPIEIGDTWSDLVERLGADPYDPDRDDFETCHYTTVSNDPLAPWVMLLGEGADATVARIELTNPTSTTVAGLGLGDTEADVLAQHTVTEEPHVYLNAGAKYLFVEPADGAESTFFFETDETGLILAARAGLVGPVRWIEGCL